MDFSYSALKTTEFVNFIGSFNDFCNLLYNFLDENPKELIELRTNLTATDSAYIEYVDFKEFIDSCISIGLETNNLLNSYFALVPFCVNSGNLNNKFGGLGINFPNSENEIKYYRKVDINYHLLDLYNETKWDDFLIKYWNYL